MPPANDLAARRRLSTRLRQALQMLLACSVGALVMLIAGKLYAARGGT